MLQPESIVASWILYPLVASTGLGLLQFALSFYSFFDKKKRLNISLYHRTGSIFPVLPPLELRYQPQAMAFLNFVRSFGQVIGISSVSLV